MQRNLPGLDAIKALPLVDNMGVCYLLASPSPNAMNMFHPDNVLGHEWPSLLRLWLTFTLKAYKLLLNLLSADY